MKIVWFVGKTHVYCTQFIIMTKRVVFFLSPLMSGKVDSVCRDKQGRMSPCPKPERNVQWTAVCMRWWKWINDIISGSQVYFWVGQSKSETEAPVGMGPSMNSQYLAGHKLYAVWVNCGVVVIIRIVPIRPFTNDDLWQQLPEFILFLLSSF